MLKKGLLLVAFIAFIIWLTVDFENHTASQKNKTLHKKEILDKQIPSAKNKETKKATPTKQKTVQQKEEVFIDNKEQELEALHKKLYFENISIEEMALSFPYRADVMPVAALSMEKNEFLNMHVGNELVFADIENMRYSTLLHAVEPMDGSQSLFGKMEEDGAQYPSIITIGEDGIGYIYLSTPRGSYQMELHNGRGYVYRGRDIK